MKSVLLILLCVISSFALTGKVIHVADGDTYTVLDAKNGQHKIRLWGIDCPEKKQAFGQKAKEFAAELVYWKIVSVEEQGSDRYGRTIGIVSVEGQEVNAALVDAGYAWWYSQYAPKAISLQRLQQKAMQGKQGLWADPHPMAPWEFRKLSKGK